MSYTWTNGEVITADKLNATGGSDEYDFILSYTYQSGLPTADHYALKGISLADAAQKSANGNPLKVACMQVESSGITTEPIIATCGSDGSYLVFEKISTQYSPILQLVSDGSADIRQRGGFTWEYNPATKEYTIAGSAIDDGGEI